MNPQDYVRRALEEDAFALYCQPIGAVGATMSYPMAEVLVRLREEESSMLPPGEFFPVLEQLGMMGALDRWVVRRVLSRLAAGCRIPRLAINLSAQSLADPSFALYFADELEGSGVAGDSVLFDVDENDAVSAPHCIARLAAPVASLGSGLIIEGFGTAADPWGALQAPGVRFVKLNGALSRRLAKGEKLDVETATLLQAVKALGIEVIADFVEETRLLRRLKTHGVRHVQGFGIYRPYPLESFGEAALRVA
jgi:EAL domain-containing protein (putative c-di-GMP-specific phosphodiesterase class I)